MLGGVYSDLRVNYKLPQEGGGFGNVNERGGHSVGERNDFNIGKALAYFCHSRQHVGMLKSMYSDTCHT